MTPASIHTLAGEDDDRQPDNKRIDLTFFRHAGTQAFKFRRIDTVESVMGTMAQ